MTEIEQRLSRDAASWPDPYFAHDLDAHARLLANARTLVPVTLTDEQIEAYQRLGNWLATLAREWVQRMAEAARAIGEAFAPLVRAQRGLVATIWNSLPWEYRRKFSPDWTQPAPLCIDGREYARRRRNRRRRR